MMDENTKAGFIAVVGRPNAGKSSLLNFFVNENITMVSHKANATRKRSDVIVMHENAQLVFIDTPGLHEREQLLNQYMMEEAMRAIGDADLILFLAPVTDGMEDYEKFLKLNSTNIPHMLLLTKIDQVSKEKLFKRITQYVAYQDRYLELIPTSIKKGTDIPHVLGTIAKHLPIHPYYYDPEILTTQNMKDIYKELIRGAIFDKTSKEIPYFSDVVIERVEESQDQEKVYAQIVVDSKSQKGIVIGNDGATLKRIGTMARESIEAINGKKTFLKLFVVVKKGWSKDKKSLQELGYNF